MKGCALLHGFRLQSKQRQAVMPRRLAGAAIIAIAICCWKARRFEIPQAAIAVVTAMLFYNLAASAVLVYAGVRLGLQSPLIWPAIVVHVVLGLWCGVLVWFSMRKH
jgi:hypothetical protein